MNNKQALAILLGALIALALVAVTSSIINYSEQEPKSIHLTVNCNGKDMSNDFKKGDSFTCDLLNSEFIIKIKNIKDNKVKLQADKYGLYPLSKNGKIDLNDKLKDFEVYKDKKLVLGLQATDISSSIEISY